MFNLLRKIKKLKVAELKNLGVKLSIIEQKKKQKIDIDDIDEALTYCIFHFKGGGFYERMGDKCPCNCLCEACEMIPESDILSRMQKIGQDIKEENVIFEFLEEYSDYIKEIEFGEKQHGKSELQG